MKRHYLYIGLLAVVFLELVLLLNYRPRSRYSVLEKRELMPFPKFTWERFLSGEYTEQIGKWYSDTEPYRDVFMTVSMHFRQWRALNIGDDDEQITYLAAAEEDQEAVALASLNADSLPRYPLFADSVSLVFVSDSFRLLVPGMSPRPHQLPAFEPGTAQHDSTLVARATGVLALPEVTTSEDPVPASEPVAEEFTTLDENAKIANHGILVLGKAPHARALVAYHGKGGGQSYAKVINTYKEKFGGDVNIYCMIIPTAVEFYCPEKARSATVSEAPTIQNTHAALLPSVRKVDVIAALRPHAGEPIYLRTDHHWAPLGAYYTARELCRVAGVHVPHLSEFEEHVVHNFVGTMYGFSQDISIKQSPEDFVYYTPIGVSYKTTYIVYDLNSNYQVVGEHQPRTGPFFIRFKDGSGSAYCTFMGGDCKITKVETSTKNGRRILILKDSFGNAIPGYLFGSFEEVHVIDGRYFNKNMVDYVTQNRITDIVFANDVFKAYAGGKQYLRFLTQHGTGEYTPQKQESDSLAAPAEDKASPETVPAEGNASSKASTTEVATPAETPEPATRDSLQ